MVNVVHGLLSSLFITIPEFIFMTIITLRIMKRKDMLDLYNIKSNALSILMITVPPAILYDALNYIVKSPGLVNRILSFSLLYILLVYILKQRDRKRGLIYPFLKSKAFIYIIVSLLLVFVIEIITLPIIFKLTNKTYEMIKVDFYQVLLCSLSSRIIQVITLIFILAKKNNKFQLNLGDYIFKNRFFMYISVSIIIGLLVYEAYFIKLILYNNLLNIVNSIYEQLFIVIGSTFLIPGLLILIVYSFINYCLLIIKSGEKQNIRND